MMDFYKDTILVGLKNAHPRKPPEREILGWFPRHDRKNPKNALDELVNAQHVLTNGKKFWWNSKMV